jgi:hypothetical protein
LGYTASFDDYLSNPHRTRHDEVAAEFGRRLMAVRDISIDSINQLISSDDTPSARAWIHGT